MTIRCEVWKLVPTITSPSLSSSANSWLESARSSAAPAFRLPPSPLLSKSEQLKIDFERRLFWRKGEEIHLSPKEFDLLAFLIKNAGFPLTHVKLLRSIWGLEYGGELEYLRSYVRMLRKKIEDDPDDPKYILTEPWVGYRFSDCSDFDAKATPATSKPRLRSA